MSLLVSAPRPFLAGLRLARPGFRPRGRSLYDSEWWFSWVFAVVALLYVFPSSPLPRVPISYIRPHRSSIAKCTVSPPFCLQIHVATVALFFPDPIPTPFPPPSPCPYIPQCPSVPSPMPPLLPRPAAHSSLRVGSVSWCSVALALLFSLCAVVR
ncbi:hypothetical protein FKP32DRAFT_137309 [Trametes sanguinea]|nr:hypothetical protein FKP32DRAFT_137309 [Trametes sanguinea]